MSTLSSSREAEPLWSPSDVRSAVSTTAIGVAMLLWAWWHSSGAAELDDQTTALVVSMLAIAVALKGLFSYAQPGRRRVLLRRAEIVDRLVATCDGVASMHRGGRAETTATDGFVNIPGSNRYHRSDCLLARGRNAKQVAANGRALDRLEPCEMCEPS